MQVDIESQQETIGKNALQQQILHFWLTPCGKDMFHREEGIILPRLALKGSVCKF